MKYGNKEWVKIENSIYKNVNDPKEFLYQFKLKNRLYRINATKNHNVKNITEARKKLPYIKATIHDKNDTGKLRPLEYYMNQHLQTITNKNTLSTYSVHWKNRINQNIGHLRVDKITPEIINLLLEKEYKGKSKIVQIRVKFVLNPIFKQLLKEGKIDRNPLDVVEAFYGYKKEKAKPIIDRLMLLEDELVQVPNILYNEIMKLDQNKRLYYLFSLMLTRRRYEILQYKLSDIKGDVLFVRPEYIKGNKLEMERIKLPKEILDELETLDVEPDGKLVKLHYTWASTYFSKHLLKNTRYYDKGFRLHDLRALFANIAVNVYHQDYWVVDACLSHSKSGTSTHYINISDERKWGVLKQYWDIVRNGKCKE